MSGLRPGTLLKKRLVQVFYCEFCEICKNNFLTKHLQTAASVNIPKEMYSCRPNNDGGAVLRILLRVL